LSLYGELSAKENLVFFGGLYGLSGSELAERVNWGLDFAGLEDRKHDRISTFSGGMKRRMNIAVALIHEPKVLLLDEPTAGVDPQSRNHIFDRNESLQDQGMTILYTTHYMEDAQRLCDRVAIIDKGKLLALDRVDGLVDQYGGKPVVTATLDRDSRTDGLPGKIQDGRVRFESTDPIEEVNRLTQKGVKFANLQIANSDLESVFLELTGRSLRD
jgi:ABC-2 type transport system ATP-binding protein